MMVTKTHKSTHSPRIKWVQLRPKYVGIHTIKLHTNQTHINQLATETTRCCQKQIWHDFWPGKKN